MRRYVLTRTSNCSIDDENQPHEVRGYDGFNRLVFQKMVSNWSEAGKLGQLIGDSKGITRIIIRCVYAIVSSQWLVKATLHIRNVTLQVDDIDVEGFRVIYYGADDYPAKTVDMEERPTRAMLLTFLRKYRHCPYATLLTRNFPVEGEGVTVDFVENPSFRTYRTIAALKQDASDQEVLAFIKENNSKENLRKIEEQYMIELGLNSARNFSASASWGYRPPRLSNEAKEFLNKKSVKDDEE